MLQVETLNANENGEYPDPDGDIVEVLRDQTKFGTLTVLTRVDRPVSNPVPFAPNEYTVRELCDRLDDEDLSKQELQGLRKAELEDKDRATAIDAINDALEAFA